MSECAYRIRVEAPYQELSEAYFWFHPYLAAVPRGGGQGPSVVLLTQKHLVADDHCSGSYLLRTDDLGATWRGPVEVPSLGWEEEAGYHRSVASLVPNWHPPTGRVLAIGHSCLYDPEGRIVDRPGATRVYYAVYDPEREVWSGLRVLQEPPPGYHGAASGCSQWLVEADGTVLLPAYVQEHGGTPWEVIVWRCTFDGERLACVQPGSRLARPDGRGLHEPSLTRYGGRYLLTIRSDDGAFASASDDGLRYGSLQPWTFDDGAPLGSYNTQQHWVTHSGGLFLAYTRRGAANDHIFRHRAPVFIAAVDPVRLAVVRASERVLLPERGAPMGNFGAAPVTERETWVTVGENMWNYGSYPPTSRGARGAILVARILWERPNGLVATARCR
ncbi:MAG: sialidase family protein [Gemmatimonadota bacterium]